MARMYPQTPSRDTKSKAELKLFSLFQAQLSDDWIVLHSLGLASHRTKPWTEIDFVLIGPLGVFCIEVKGGRIKREQGKYCFINRHDERSYKHEGPFEQVGTASAALHAFLRERLPSISSTVVGYGVVTPDITWTIQGPDVIPDLILDERDISLPIQQYLSRIGKYWADKIHRREIEPLSRKATSEILCYLRGDFDIRVSLNTRISAADAELIALTRQQYELLDDFPDNLRVLVRGGAGTGKTLLAVEEAQRFNEQGKRTLFCCFNKELARYLRTVMRKLDLVDVHHIHGLMLAFIREAGLESHLPPAEPDDLFRIFYPQVCADALLVLERLGYYRTLIVDEAQDILLPDYLEIFDGLLTGGLANGEWRLFLDPNQNLFHSLSDEAMSHILEQRPAQRRLTKNCRNTEPVAVATQILSGVRTGSTLQVDGPEVEHVFYNDDAEQQRLVSKMINQMLSEGIKPNDIVILSPKGLRTSCMKNGLRGVSYPLVEYGDSSASSKSIRFSTIGAFKGLESRVCLLVDVSKLEGPQGMLPIYVGASRARTYLAVFLSVACREAYATKAQEYGKQIIANACRKISRDPLIEY